MKGLCFSGGGIKIAAHIGALKAFEEENIKFDCVSGASSGSIVAVMYAIGYNSDEMWKYYNKIAPKIKYFEWKNILKLLYGLIFQKKIIINGLNSGKAIEKYMREMCNRKKIYNISQIKMPVNISMVDAEDGTTYIATSVEKRLETFDDVKYITDIPVCKAIRASCGFPIIFTPYEYNNMKLIDGGVRENLPWKSLKEIGADEIIAICFETTSSKGCCDNMIDVAVRALELQERELANYEKEGIENLITINMEKVSLLDYQSSEKMYKCGYEQAKKQISLYKHNKIG